MKLRLLTAMMCAVALFSGCDKSEGPAGKVLVDPNIGHDYPPHTPPTDEEIDNEADEDPM